MITDALLVRAEEICDALCSSVVKLSNGGNDYYGGSPHPRG